jgi:hypothetical protein
MLLQACNRAGSNIINLPADDFTLVAATGRGLRYFRGTTPWCCGNSRAAGLPVVSSDVAGENGLLVPKTLSQSMT